MEDSTHPYVKLAKTPLAQQTTVCGLPAKTASLIMGIFALVVVSGSHFVLGVLLLGSRVYHDDASDLDVYRTHMGSWRGQSDFAEISKRHDDMFNASVLSVVGGLALFCAIITTITGIIVLVGALAVRPQLFLPWFIVMMFGITLGRLGPLMSSIFGANPYTVFFILMACVDIVTIILVMICWGQLAGVQRNARFMKMHLSVRHVKSGEAGGVLLPPGSYPRQEL